MGVILGIDIGGSSTKIVGLHENGTVIDMLRVKAEDPLTSLYGALTMLPPAHETFALFTQLYGVEYIIPENATFATAIGAALYSMRRDR